ncbi:zinc finger protein [Loa loa]|uniref:Zinc finger protein n=1 Tax=Loa loa TaxID=7209 RepID=A0A1I7V6T9_LOALO|nr:zinc finger protein [Loa loa]EJD73675.1 zinc finger protein [Loa loa]
MAYIIWFNLLLCIASVQNSPVKQKHKCRYCNVTTLTHKEYLKHYGTHKEEGLYKCTWSTCGRKFHTSKGLQQHYEKHQPKLLCEICGSFLSFKKGLGEHKKRCHGVRGRVERNPHLGHTLVDIRNHRIAGQASLGQQDDSGNEYFSENFTDVISESVIKELICHSGLLSVRAASAIPPNQLDNDFDSRL